MSEKPWETAPLPSPNYGCAVLRCREEVTYDADMLAWWQGGPSYPAGWYCYGCWDEAATKWVSQYEDNRDPSIPDAPALSEELERRDAAPDMLAALKRVDRTGGWGESGITEPGHTVIDQVRAAIAKAEGVS